MRRFTSGQNGLKVGAVRLLGQRALIFCGLLLAASEAVFAGAKPPPAEQDMSDISQWGRGGKKADMRSMSERWTGDPDYSRSSEFDGVSFQGKGDIQSNEYMGGKKEFGAKMFNHRGEFVTREHYTREWADSRKGWGSRDKQYATKEANTDTGKVIPKAGDIYTTRNLDQKEAYDASKKVQTDAARENDRPFVVKGTRQDILDQQNDPGAPLTVDQVKELLNKSK